LGHALEPSSAAEPAWSVFDTMRDRGLGRIWLKREGSEWKRLCTGADEEWAPCDERAPGLRRALDACESLARASEPKRIEFVCRADIGLRLLVVVHRPERGRSLGALRRIDFATPEDALVRTGLNLARLMTTKAGVAGAPFGGSQLIVHGPPLPEFQAEAWYAALAEEIDLSGATVTADSGISLEAAAGIQARTASLVGAREGGSARAAAAGAHAAFRAATAGLGKPPGETLVIVQGLGRVGAELARLIAADGARLVVSDREIRKIDSFLGDLPPLDRKLVSVLAPYQVLEVPADVFCPCAQGGVLGEASPRTLKVNVVVGPADGQFQADSFEQEKHLSAALFRAGISCVPEWIASAGSAIHGLLESERKDAFDVRTAIARTQRTCGWLTDEIMQASKRLGRSPIEVAIERLPIESDGRVMSANGNP
jgi:glutamate dehydrogenase/leucine dehydrogenase